MSESDLVIYPSKGKMLLLSFGFLVFLGGTIAMLAARDEMHLPAVAMGIIALGIPLFGGGLIWSCSRLIKPRPALVLDRTGIFDDASAMGAGWLRWEEIVQVYPYTFGNQRYLGIVPVDAVIDRQPAGKRMGMRANLKMKVAPVNVPLTMIPIPVEQLMETIEQYRRAALNTAAASTVVQLGGKPEFGKEIPAAGSPRALSGEKEYPGYQQVRQRGISKNQDAATLCPDCGANALGAKFCPQCGKPLQPQSQCAQCGARFPATTKFCPDCGVKIT